MSDLHALVYNFLVDQLGEGVEIWLTDPDADHRRQFEGDLVLQCGVAHRYELRSTLI